MSGVLDEFCGTVQDQGTLFDHQGAAGGVLFLCQPLGQFPGFIAQADHDPAEDVILQFRSQMLDVAESRGDLSELHLDDTDQAA